MVFQAMRLGMIREGMSIDGEKKTKDWPWGTSTLRGQGKEKKPAMGIEKEQLLR